MWRPRDPISGLVTPCPYIYIYMIYIYLYSDPDLFLLYRRKQCAEPNLRLARRRVASTRPHQCNGDVYIYDI